MKVKIMVSELTVPRGDMFIIEGRMAEIAYAPSPFVSEEGPGKIIVCHPDDEERLREAIEETPEMELVE